MNLTNFLKQTDTITAQYSSAQLISFIHDMGRVLPENRREDFLKRLKAAGRNLEKESSIDAENELKFCETYKLVRNHLKTIDSQEIAIDGTLNEVYGDWYDDSDEEYYYEDNSGISDMLAEACDFVHTCMDMERYKEGFEVGSQIFSLEILCQSEWGDQELTIGDLVYHNLLQCDLIHVCLDTAYCAYHAVSPAKRPEALYEVIANAKINEVTLETIMQYGDEELPDFQDFLTRWLAYLGAKSGKAADRLILEAVGLLNNVSVAAQYAGKYVAVHPGLYLSILENGKYENADDMVSVGMEAMKLMPKKYRMRSRVALKTAEYTIEAKESASLLEKCYFIAYESDTCALNYLRALLNGYGTEKKRAGLQKVFMALPGNKGSNAYSYNAFERERAYSEREENKPDGNMLLLLRFLDGQFADVLAKGLNKSEALGWTGTFMKQGIALYLLYLYEGQWDGRGMNRMADIVKNEIGFSAEKYRQGTYGCSDTDENELFYKLFSKWKSMTPMETDIRIRALKKITRLLEKRTEGIMGANRRNYYGECAAYIAALGEVRESQGEAGAKQKLMTAYKDKYTKRRAFREEMRNYGWVDSKR